MLVYASKKIAIPNNIRLACVSWDSEDGWIACGGEKGVLKVLRLESPAETAAKAPGEPAAPTNFKLNQSLEGHSGTVDNVCWNPFHNKLTTADTSGLIIVWILHEGMWYEEMINSRDKSQVASMQWNKDGQKICIAYADGAIICGTADGSRMWGKDLKKTELSQVQWSPDSKKLLFATTSGELQLFDGQGTFISKLNNFCNEGVSVKVSSIAWYNGANGYIEPNIPCLAVCYENGKIQILRSESDTSPIIVTTGLKHLNMKWNNNGAILAVSGTEEGVTNVDGEVKDVALVVFYSPLGQLIRTMKVPGSVISSLSWEQSGLRIAVSIDSFIYFANVRLDYKWTFFARDVLVYSYTKPEKTETAVIFWNAKTDDSYIKVFSNLSAIASYGELCLLATKAENGNDTVLSLCNAVGMVLESKTVEFEVKFAAISRSHVFAASSDIIYYWQYKGVSGTKVAALDSVRKKDKEKVFHIDEMTYIGAGESGQALEKLQQRPPSSDPITAIVASETMLVASRKSGEILQFSSPNFNFENSFTGPENAMRIELNQNSTQLAILDIDNIFRIADMQDSKMYADFERKDVWEFQWASDTPDSIAVMEKAKLIFFHNLKMEDPLLVSGYICNYSDLSVKTVQLDEMLKHTEIPRKDLLQTYESAALTKVRNLLSNEGLDKAFQHVDSQDLPCLWKLIAEKALENSNFHVAQRAFVRASDYQGLQFLKRIQKITDFKKQKAEIAAFFSKFDEAEKLYLNMDRKDLAVELRMRLGDWFRVIQLARGPGGLDDHALERVWNAIGDHFYQHQDWQQAVSSYEHAKNTKRLISCYYILDNFPGLERISSMLTDAFLLKEVANKFTSVGLCDQAVEALVRCADVKGAIDVCISLNNWSKAVSLAQKHNFRDMETLLHQYAVHLIADGKKMEAVELYRKAGLYQKSAKILYEEALRYSKSDEGHKRPVTLKKMFVLAALELDQYSRDSKVTSALDDLLHADDDMEDMSSDPEKIKDRENARMVRRLMETPWRAAEAWHFYAMAQRQFYNGSYDSAVTTSMHLLDYADILNAKRVYTLIAHSSLFSRRFRTCSKAFTKLEAMGTAEEQEKFEHLAFDLFAKFTPLDPTELPNSMCYNCMSSIHDSDVACPVCHVHFSKCIASGRPITDPMHFICPMCKQRAYESEVMQCKCCPLCHIVL